jgi:hypothetical protein
MNPAVTRRIDAETEDQFELHNQWSKGLDGGKVTACP